MANKTVGDLLADFELKHAQKKHANERRRARSKKIQELETQKRTLLLKKLECAFLQGDLEDFDGQIATVECAIRKAEQEEGLSAAYDCSVCEDKGIVKGRYCDCFLREVYRKVYGAADVSALHESFDHFDFSVFDNSALQKNGRTQRQMMELYADICRDYIKKFPQTIKQNILLRGKAGLGKTYLLNCMAVEAERMHIDVCLIRATALFDVFFKHRMGEEMPLSFLRKAKLLLVDDLGTEPITQNVSIEYLFDLLNRRMEAGLHTVVATNIDDLQKRYDERISSRLEAKRACTTLFFDGDDLRLK